MRPLQLRTSLALYYTTILAAVLTLLGLGTHRLVLFQLDASVRDNLEEKSRGLHAYLQVKDGAPVVEFDRTDPEESAFVADATRYYQIYDAKTGELLVQSASMEALGLHDTPGQVAELVARPVLRDIETDRGRLRLATSLVKPRGGGTFLLQVGEPLTSIDRSLKALDRYLWYRTAAGILIAALLSRWLSSLALAPMSRLAKAVTRIGVRTLDSRVELRGTGDEIDRVAAAFNRTLARLERSVREMRQFSGAIAHELRTPITVLRGEAEFEVAHPLPVEEREERLLGQIAQYDHLTQLINRILMLARAEAGDVTLSFAPVALGSLACSVTEQLEAVAAASGVGLTCEVAHDPTVEADAGWIERLLLILLDNAIKYTPGGGHVAVLVTTTTGHARLEVSDTGMGIPAQAIPHLFEPFYRVESQPTRRTPGAGLGLALARWIAERHDARIEVRSTPDAGTVFVVTFPLTREPAAAAPGIPATPPAHSTGR